MDNGWELHPILIATLPRIPPPSLYLTPAATSACCRRRTPGLAASRQTLVLAVWHEFWYNRPRTGFLSFVGDISASTLSARWGREMAKSTLTFELGGRLDVRQLVEGITSFHRLIAALTANSEVDWVVEDLHPGSAAITIHGEADNPAKIERIVDLYGELGQVLERQEDLHYSPSINRAANEIQSLARSVAYVRFETPDADYTIYSNGQPPSQPSTTSAIGAVTGRVQTLSNRGGLRFNLYESIFDKAVSCYLAQGQEEHMREVWGRRARVSGRVSREVATGRPIAVRQIASVELLQEEEPGYYRLARGAAPWQEGDLLPEEVIRRLRDARYAPVYLVNTATDSPQG